MLPQLKRSLQRHVCQARMLNQTGAHSSPDSSLPSKCAYTSWHLQTYDTPYIFWPTPRFILAVPQCPCWLFCPPHAKQLCPSQSSWYGT